MAVGGAGVMVLLAATLAPVPAVPSSRAAPAPPAAAAAAGAADAAEDPFPRDFAETRGFRLGRPVRPVPTPDGRSVFYLRARGSRDPVQELYEYVVGSGQNLRRLGPAELAGADDPAAAVSPQEKARRERQRISVGGFVAFESSRDGSALLLPLGDRLFLYDRATARARPLPTGPGPLLDPKFSPDGRTVAYVRGSDLYALDLASGREQAVTTGGTERRPHGLAEFVAQEEMDRPSGYWWSPDGRSLVVATADATAVESWFPGDPAHPEKPPLRSDYPRPGHPNVVVTLAVVPFDPAAAAAVPAAARTEVRWDQARYPYLAQVDWSEWGPLTLTVQSRDQRELALLRADPATGQTAVLCRESDPAWVNLDQSCPRWVDPREGGGFLWSSERAGAWQLERRNADGSLRQVLAPPAAGYQRLVGVLAGPAGAQAQALFLASADPTQARVCRAPLAGGAAVVLDHEEGVHAASAGRSQDRFVDQFATFQQFQRTVVRRLDDGAVVAELPSAAEEPAGLPRVELVETATTPAFRTAVVRPRPRPGRGGSGTAAAGPDPDRRPVVVDVYGGPGHNVVRAAAQPYVFDQWLADQGFVVVAVDGRGTPGRGRDWERALRGRFGEVPLADQVAGLQALLRRFPDELDGSRVGITGWSFGGYLAGLAALRRPDVYRAAVAGAPVVDWLDYDTHYTERYLGLPEENPEAYRQASLLTYAPQLSAALWLVHGTADDNVYFRHSLRLADALFRAGRPFQFQPLEGMTHMVPDPSTRALLSRRTAEFFRQHLLAPGGGPGAPAP